MSLSLKKSCCIRPQVCVILGGGAHYLERTTMRFRMKNYMRLLPIFAALSGLLVAGCATDAPATVSAQAPPLPKVETIGIAPGPLYDWVPGYWAFKDGQWDWIPGSWQGRPR